MSRGIDSELYCLPREVSARKVHGSTYDIEIGPVLIIFPGNESIVTPFINIQGDRGLVVICCGHRNTTGGPLGCSLPVDLLSIDITEVPILVPDREHAVRVRDLLHHQVTSLGRLVTQAIARGRPANGRGTISIDLLIFQSRCWPHFLDPEKKIIPIWGRQDRSHIIIAIGTDDTDTPGSQEHVPIEINTLKIDIIVKGSAL